MHTKMDINEYLTDKEMRRMLRILAKAKKRFIKKRKKEGEKEQSMIFFNCQYSKCNDGRTDYQCWQSIAAMIDQILDHCKKRGCPYVGMPVEDGIDERLPEGWE